MWPAPEALIKSVVYIGYREGDQHYYTASGFLIRVDERANQEPQEGSLVFLVTVKHVAARIVAEKGNICCAIDALGTPLIKCDLPNNAWVYHDEEDIAILRFDWAWLTKPPIHPLNTWSWFQLVSTVSTWQFAAAPGGQRMSFSDAVHMVGLWSRTKEPSFPPIVRTGFFAAASPQRIQLDTGKTTLYMIDGTVTVGMSGGLAFITQGAGSAQNFALGVIAGVWTLQLDELAAVDEKVFVDNTGAKLTPQQQMLLDAYRQLKAEVRVLNSRIALVVRDIVLSNFVSETLGRGPTGIYDNRT